MARDRPVLIGEVSDPDPARIWAPVVARRVTSLLGQPTTPIRRNRTGGVAPLSRERAQRRACTRLEARKRESLLALFARQQQFSSTSKGHVTFVSIANVRRSCTLAASSYWRLQEWGGGEFITAEKCAQRFRSGAKHLRCGRTANRYATSTPRLAQCHVLSSEQ